jgi:hypothetical protein
MLKTGTITNCSSSDLNTLLKREKRGDVRDLLTLTVRILAAQRLSVSLEQMR